MKKIIITTAIAATMALSACSSTPTSSASSYDATVAAALAAHKQAKSLNNVWKNKHDKSKLDIVSSYLAKAAKAKKKGDIAAANALAASALKTAKAEVAQSKAYANLQPAWYK